MNTTGNRSSWRRMPPGKGAGTTTVLSVAIAFLLATGAAARPAADAIRRVVTPSPDAPNASRTTARTDTLWIFDADFEDLLGDNAGWTGEDLSGTLAQENYWHKDTIRINGFTHLGDSTWWCGKYDPCWRQPRGYGNDWYQLLSRDFPEVALHTDPGDTLILEYDQRVAMELSYDYGYTDVSTDGGSTWITVRRVCNAGFVGTPGISTDWNSTEYQAPGHVSIDLTDYAGLEMQIRFRFESDFSFSSQDQYDSLPYRPVGDGAWQLDNILLRGGSPLGVIFFDDCESPGDNGWVHDDIPATGQAGVAFWRGLYGTDIWTNRSFTCAEGSGWMYAAVDPLTSRMVDNEYAWLVSPPINVEGAIKLVGQWEGWIDLPRESDDVFNLFLASSDNEGCIQRPDGFFDECPGWWYGGPEWGVWTDDWSGFAGNDWLAIRWEIAGGEPWPGYEHMGGFFLARQRVGIPAWDEGMTFETDPWDTFNDLFIEQLNDALLDSALVRVNDDDGVLTVLLVASNDAGASWASYECHPHHFLSGSGWWTVPPPDVQMTAGSEIWYYYEAEDELGNTSVFPAGAPDEYFEFSVLPINGSVDEPAVLLVDKDGGATAGEDRRYGHSTEYYYREMLGILGHEFDVYDVPIPGSAVLSDGPDFVGMSHYDTQVWFTGATSGYIISPSDQANLTQWLGEAEEGAERNLLMTGNDIGKELDGSVFYTSWLAAEFLDGGVGVVTEDSVPGLRGFAGGFDFMTFADRECVLRGGCPELAYLDVVQPQPGVFGAELVVEYVKADLTTRPAGVAYTDPTGYQAVTLGFGMELMSDVVLPTGYFASGAPDRVDLMANIMEYFEKEPTAPGTGTEGAEAFTNHLSQARPNPFNPRTTIEYAVAVPGRVVLRIYDVTGRLVRTLVDRDVDVGEHRMVWDGTTDSGQRAASGVYFVKMEAAGHSDGFRAARKLVLLK